MRLSRVAGSLVGWFAVLLLSLGGVRQMYAAGNEPSCHASLPTISCPPESCTVQLLDGPFDWCETLYVSGTPWCCEGVCYTFRCMPFQLPCGGNYGVLFLNGHDAVENKACEQSLDSCGATPKADCK